MQVAIFVCCYLAMWRNKIFIWPLSKRNYWAEILYHYSRIFANNNHGSFLPHYGWTRDIFPRQPYKCVSYEMSHEANHIYFSCLIPVRMVFCMATCCCNDCFNQTFLLWCFYFSHWPSGGCCLGDDKCEEIAREVKYNVFVISSNTRRAGTQCLQLYDILPLPLRQEGIHNDGHPRCIWCICGHSCTGSHFLACAHIKVEVVGWIYHLASQEQFGFCININL